MDKDYYEEGVWLQIGNYALRNKDGSITKHGSTFKATSRSKFYLTVLEKLIDGRMDNVINSKFIVFKIKNCCNSVFIFFY